MYADGQENIALTGKGKVVGPPTSCEIYKCNESMSSDKVIRKPLATVFMMERMVKESFCLRHLPLSIVRMSL